MLVLIGVVPGVSMGKKPELLPSTNIHTRDFNQKSRMSPQHVILCNISNAFRSPTPYVVEPSRLLSRVPVLPASIKNQGISRIKAVTIFLERKLFFPPTFNQPSRVMLSRTKC